MYRMQLLLWGSSLGIKTPAAHSLTWLLCMADRKGSHAACDMHLIRMMEEMHVDA